MYLKVVAQTKCDGLPAIYRWTSLGFCSIWVLPLVRDADIFDIDYIRCDLYVEADRGFCGLIWSANGLLLGVKAVTSASRIALAA